MATYWEQEEVSNDIPVYNVDMKLNNKSYCVLQIRGDEHYGLRGLDEQFMIETLKTQQQKYRNNMLVLNTGDAIENSLKKSIGHNYDVQESDPDIQIKKIIEIYDELDKHLYGPKFNTMKACNRRSTRQARRFGVIGNHEYRTRKATGQWLNNLIYSGKGVVDAGIHCLINLNLTNSELKLKKSYRIYMAHRLTNSASAISHATLLKNFQKKKADIDADIYVCGHYHRKYIDSDIKFTKDGKRKKVMYVCNPAPCLLTEYAAWAQYSPNDTGIFVNLYLPIDGNMHGII